MGRFEAVAGVGYGLGLGAGGAVESALGQNAVGDESLAQVPELRV